MTDVPPDAFTVADYAARYHMTEAGAHSQLRRMMLRGDVLMGKRSALATDGRRRMFTVFWVPNESHGQPPTTGQV
jgi:hypothetical protein